jgi:hypothetical protein
MRRLALIGALAFVAACSSKQSGRAKLVSLNQQVTWAGAQVLLLDAGCDGGFVDAGEGTLYDAGPASWDAGVCADGGTGNDCNACQGTCSHPDGGNLQVDGGPGDGGWAGNVALCLPFSDPINIGNYLEVAISCPLNCAATTNATATAILEQANQDQNWSWVPSTSQTATCGGYLGDAGFFWSESSSFEFLRVLFIANGPGDGGVVECTQFPKGAAQNSE